MSKIAFIIPYYGQYPLYFNLWLESVKYNPTIDFILITDNQGQYDYPANVHLIPMLFDELKARFRSILGQDICLETPYKLCDYRPGYGLVFQDLLMNYDYWGYCDIDLIFGDIRSFLTKEMLESNLKLYSHGHFVLIKNTYEMNQLFLVHHTFPGYTFHEIKRVNLSTHFDEWKGFGIICKHMQLPCYDNNMDFADVNYNHYQFHLNDHNDGYRPQIMKWKAGTLYLYYLEKGQLKEKRCLYVHLQKRTMMNEVKHVDKGFYIVPNQFIENDFIRDTDKLIQIGRYRRFYLKKYKIFFAELKKNLTYLGILYRLKLWNKQLRYHLKKT